MTGLWLDVRPAIPTAIHWRVLEDLKTPLLAEEKGQRSKIGMLVVARTIALLCFVLLEVEPYRKSARQVREGCEAL